MQIKIVKNKNLNNLKFLFTMILVSVMLLKKREWRNLTAIWNQLTKKKNIIPQFLYREANLKHKMVTCL